MNILFSLLAGLGFGIAMFLRKLSVNNIGMIAFILETVTEAISAIILVTILFPNQLTNSTLKYPGLLFGITGGISICMGVIFFYLAIKFGPALTPSIIGPVLSAIIASLLAVVILGETVSLIKIIGAVIAMIGLFLFIRG